MLPVENSMAYLQLVAFVVPSQTHKERYRKLYTDELKTAVARQDYLAAARVIKLGNVLTHQPIPFVILT